MVAVGTYGGSGGGVMGGGPGGGGGALGRPGKRVATGSTQAGARGGGDPARAPGAEGGARWRPAGGGGGAAATSGGGFPGGVPGRLRAGEKNTPLLPPAPAASVNEGRRSKNSVPPMAMALIVS